MARLLTTTPGWTVIATARSQTRADELRALLGDPGNFRYVVCDQGSIAGTREAGERIVELLADPRHRAPFAASSSTRESKQAPLQRKPPTDSK